LADNFLLKKSRIEAFPRLKERTKDRLGIVVIFSEPVMESLLDSVAHEMGMKEFFASESYISFMFNLKDIKEEDAFTKVKNYLKRVDDELVKSPPLEFPFKKHLAV